MARRRRRYGTGSVYPKDGRWVAQVVVRGPEGQRRYVTRWRKTEREARAALDLLVSRYSEQRAGDERQLVSRFLADWLEGLRLSPATIRAYRTHITKHIDPILGGIELGDLRIVDVQRLIGELERSGLSAATIGNVVLTLSAALQVAVRDSLVSRNVARLAHRPQVIREPVRAMPEAEAAAILDAASTTPYAALVALLMGAGLRIGEALALDWRDVDFDAGTVNIRKAKTPRGRRLASVAPFALEALRVQRTAARRVGPNEPVFMGERSRRRLTAGTATHAIPWLTVRAGLPRRHAHELRHAHATLLRASGTDMRVIADQLGHANPAITARIYAHVLPGEQKRATDRLGAMLTERLTG